MLAQREWGEEGGRGEEVKEEGEGEREGERECDVSVRLIRPEKGSLVEPDSPERVWLRETRRWDDDLRHSTPSE